MEVPALEARDTAALEARANAALEARVNAALDEVRPGIHRDGGDVWLIRVEDSVAFVQMVGACGGCSMVASTLKGAIEVAVRSRCPEVARVEQV
jgi:Fe-S cluster biogenesis protein NfuA